MVAEADKEIIDHSHKHKSLEELKNCAEHSDIMKGGFGQQQINTKAQITAAIQELMDDPQYKDFNPDEDRNLTIRLIARKLFENTFSNKKDIDTISDILIKEVSIKNNMDKIKQEVLLSSPNEEQESSSPAAEEV
jgi:hypothetical protein